MRKFTHLDTIISPNVTEKSTSLSEFNKVVFKVHKGASKDLIKKNIEKIFKVNVIKVNTIKINGKSKLVDLIELSLGGYARSMDVGYLTTKKGCSASASPEVESIKSARFVWMSEPEKTDTIYVGKLKLMTGGDKMTTRGLYKETTQFKPQFKIILMCNELPKLGGNDGGIWRRIEVVEYISKFTDEPRPSPADPYQYKADEQLSKKLELWNTLFVIKLLDKSVSYTHLTLPTNREV